jgi:hypothetical protein
VEAPLSICTNEEMRGVIRFLFPEGVNLWKLIVESSLSTRIIVYRAVKFTSGEITSEREELLYAMGRDQEGRQHQGLRIIIKPLKELYGKIYESQWTTLCRL